MQAAVPAKTIRSLLPRGQTLPDDAFHRRHHWIQRLLWLHVVGIPLFALAQGFGVIHSVLEGLPLVAIAVAARFTDNRRVCASLMAVGLLTSSALLVHLWHGQIEADFHYFVMIPVLALYEDWIPCLLAVAYVALHHGAAGAIDADVVYNHADGREEPWKWAAIHGVFVAAAGVVALGSWRLNEEMRAQTQRESAARAEAEAVASALGRGLRPDRLPSLEQGDVAASYLPAGTREIGGDWYDVIPLPDGRLVLTLGDVAGHGVLAASAMAELRHSTRAYAHEGLSPAQVAVRIDRFFQGEFATFLYVVYDPEAEELRYVNAGHLPPLVVAPDGEPRFLSEELSIPLGVGERTAFQEGVVEFPAGSTILAYTDGLVERRGAALDLQLDRLAQATRGCNYGAQALCDHVLAAFPPDGTDDVALLAFRATPAASEVLAVPAEPRALAAARQRVRAWMAAFEADGGALENMVLAVDEAITNAIAHSGTERGARVELDHRDGEVRVSVRDFGHWKEHGSDPDHGRGLMLVSALTDRFHVEATETGTVVTMISKVVRPAIAAPPGDVPLVRGA